MPKSSRTLDISARIAVAVIISVGPALVTVGLLTNQLILIVPGATIVAGPFLLFRQLRKAGLDHPRPIIAGLLCLIGVLFLGYLTPLFGSIFVSQPTITSASNRQVFSVTWQPVNNQPQTVFVTFDTVNNQFFIRFFPYLANDKPRQHLAGILYVEVPFQLNREVYSDSQVTNSFFGNWTFGEGSQVFNPGGWHARLDYNYSDPQNYPCKNNGGQCQDAFEIPQLLRSDLNGVLSMEVQYRALLGGSINICGLSTCAVSSQNMTVDALIVVPHNTSSLQTSPSPSTTEFNQAYTVLEWFNLSSPVFLSYVSPHLLAQYQFFILTSGILTSTGVAMEMDAIAKWIEAKNKRRRESSPTRHEVQDNFL